MSLFGPNSVFNINRGSGPLGYGVVHPVPSQHLKLYSVCRYSLFSIITSILSEWLKIILGEACLLFHSQQRQFLWPDQHLLWTLRCSPCSSGGRGQFRPLPDNPEHRQEEETEASWGWWSADGGGVEEYSDTFYKSHGENRAENVIMYPSWLDWVERNIKYVESPDVQI